VSRPAAQTFTPVADTFASSSKPRLGHGTAPALKIDRSPATVAYLRFEPSGLKGRVTKATLRLYSRTSSHAGFEVRHVANSAWKETSLNYENAPAYSARPAGVSRDVRSGAWSTVDVTGLVKGDAPVSLALVTTSSSGLTVDSRQGAQSPTLTVETTATVAPPPPGTAAAVTPSADAFVSSSKPNTNYGTNTRLKMDESPVMRTYVRFDVGALPAPLTRATLQVYSRTRSSAGFEVHAVSDTTWDEKSITYTNAPGYSSVASGLSGPVASGTWTTVDVTQLVSGSGPVSLALVTPSMSELDFDSRQGPKSPKLTLETSSGDTTAPGLPGNLAATSATASSLGLSWSASTDNVGVAGYDVFLDGARVASTTSTGYSFGGLACGTSHTLGVEAYDAAGNHSTRATLAAATSACLDTQPPSSPTGLASSAATPTSIVLSWSRSTDNVGVTGYDLYSNGARIGSTSGLQYTFGSLACGTSYTLGVEAHDAAGNHSTRATLAAATAACAVSTPFRYAYSSDADPVANANLGVNLIDTGSQWSADQLPAGLRGMVWVGDYDNTTCSWEVSDSSLSSTVTAAKGDAKVFGWFFSDEPNPLACPNAPAQHRARSDLIHSLDPSTKTFIVLDSNGFAGNLTQDAIDQIPLWLGAADFIGLDPYPCLVNKSCNYTFISNMIAKADSTGIPYVGVLQAFDGTGAGEQFRLPTPTELQTMVNLWAASHEVGSGFFAWDWAPANWNLNAHPELESVIQGFYTGGGGGDTLPPTQPSGLSAGAATATSVSLSWTASTDNVGVTGYSVYRGSSLSGTTTSTGYTVGSLACGTTYTFGVEAKDAAGNVSTRATATAATSPCPATLPPSNTGAPVISGTPVVGGLLQTSNGTWTNSPTSYAYQWRRCDTSGSNCSAIVGATMQGYTPVTADQGSTLVVDVTAANSAGKATATSLPTTVVQQSSSDPVIVAAGDICGSPTDCSPTADLIGTINPTAVLTLGDHAYTTGSAADFTANYDPNWGRYKAITKPAPGNHEYDYGNELTGYFAYFNNPPEYYSYDIGNWHVISLNGEISASAGSAQETWLRSDLAAHSNMCTLAYWHEPRWSSGYHGSSSYFGAFWTDLYNSGADVVLNGHDHDYERFAPQSPSASLDTAHGIREFVVGTGGDSHYTFSTIAANSEVRDSTSFGVLKLTLHPGGYDWHFVPVPGSSFTDSGTTSCH
jgi:chitodextrinase